MSECGSPAEDFLGGGDVRGTYLGAKLAAFRMHRDVDALPRHPIGVVLKGRLSGATKLASSVVAVEQAFDAIGG